MDAGVRRDLVRKAVLLQIKKGCTRYTKIRDGVTAKCEEFASSNTVKKQFYNYLVSQGYIERIRPGKCRLIQKGENLLTVLCQSAP